ncbi:PPC domain-containing protein [Aliikangiella maris]|uniref:Pre-peptidase C-terminal domain-containing protein n=2 Tax=Aliikangiella maris TaxID=3162458 RepID=A0ABV2BPT2_9GAMM
MKKQPKLTLQRYQCSLARLFRLVIFSLSVISLQSMASVPFELASAEYVNQPPEVDAGEDIVVGVSCFVDPYELSLNGSVSDPENDKVSVMWTVENGPTDVVFTNPNSVATKAILDSYLNGPFQFKLTATDGEHSVSDLITIEMLPTPGAPPQVSAGGNHTVIVDEVFDLNGQVFVPCEPQIEWTGPDEAQFTNRREANTQVTFSAPGVYRLTLREHKSGEYDIAEITVNPKPIEVTPLENGVSVMGISAAADEPLYYSLEVTEGAFDVWFMLYGGYGNADLYVKRDELPVTDNYDCRSVQIYMNYEWCHIQSDYYSPLVPGIYQVMVYPKTAIRDWILSPNSY